ncbi:hypothetical protein SLS62_001558 [Diatrype stigma]|uniref:Transmembrane protein n=1 Tax=Diatrype stigma TaxID=117547 RepID=A0AAN9YVM8_9PEZI
MDPRFPRGISAVRIASFVSTAAWIQGTAADEEVALPPEALNNFLRRHGVRANKVRQAATPTTTPAAEGEGEEEGSEAEEGEKEEDDKSSVSSGDSGSQAGVSSATGSSGASSLENGDSKNLAGGEPNPGSQAAIQGGDPSGLATVDPGPNLSPGALAAIIVWSIIGFLAIAGLAFFFVRRRRRARQQQDDDEARSGEPMAMQGAAPSVIEPPMHLRPGSQGSRSPPSVMMEPPAYPVVEPVQPVYLRPQSQDAAPQVPMDPTSPMQQQLLPQYQMPQQQQQQQEVRPPSVAPSGQWMPVPPWQEEPPTWRDPHPWRTSSQPSVAPIGLPANPRATRQAQAALAARQQGVDRTTKYTAASESTIFAYR